MLGRLSPAHARIKKVTALNCLKLTVASPFG